MNLQLLYPGGAHLPPASARVRLDLATEPLTPESSIAIDFIKSFKACSRSSVCHWELTGEEEGLGSDERGLFKVETWFPLLV